MMAVAVALHEVRRVIESAMGGRALPAWDQSPEGSKLTTMQDIDDAAAGKPVEPLVGVIVNMMMEKEDPKPVKRPVFDPAARPDIAKLLE
jgi:hypothetical protein